MFLFLHEMCLGHVLEESELYLIILKKEKKNYAWDTHATVSEEYPALKIHTTQTQQFSMSVLLRFKIIDFC